jgi:phosphoenolpyruvate---glycerone phosphotransferase subunit DhaM
VTPVADLVGLVIVSHSARLAEGVAELAGQMAPDVALVPAGGAPDGGLGTDFEAVSAALDRADRGAGVLLLYDLGSARMTAELALEAVAKPERVMMADAPLVEGAVAAAVAAQGGAALEAVAGAARSAGRPEEAGPGEAGPGETGGASAAEAAAPAPQSPAERAELELTNDIGLHARPAALLVRSLAGLDAEVTVRLRDRRADARSVLAVMGLAAERGDRIEVSARGPQATEALSRISDLVKRNFEE